MQAILEKQTALLQSIDKNLSNDRLIQLSQAALQVKTDKDINTDNDLAVDALHEIRNAIKKGIQNKSDTGAHARLDHIKSTLDKSLNTQKDILATFEKISNTKSDQPTVEQTVEAQRLTEENNKLLKQLVENTEPKQEKEEEKKKEDPGLLGGIGTALAIALGSVAGMIQAQIKAIKFFTNLFVEGVSKFGTMLETALVKLSKWFPSIKNVLFEIEATFVITMHNIKEFFNGIGKKAKSIFDSIEYFIGNTLSKVMKSDVVKNVVSAFENVVNGVKAFFAPLTKEFAIIEESSGAIQKVVQFVQSKIAAFKEFFEIIGTKMGNFAKIFSSTAKIVSKLAFPLTVIMTIWDTVKGALEGYEKEGIVGLFSGAIKGLISSLVTAPIDMLKDAVSWILNMFGFDKAAKFLDSFSFDDIMKKFVDAVFHPIDTIKAMFETISKFFENFTIPEIGFTIPFINKKVSIGPFQPFKSDKPAEAKPESGSGDTATKSSVTSTASAPSPTASKEATANPAYKSAYDSAIAQGKTPEEAKAIAEKSTTAGVAPAPATAAGAAAPSNDANAVYSKSSDNQQAAINNQGSTGPITVSAPTINNTSTNKQNIAAPQPVRNDDSGFNRYTRQNMVMM